MTDIALEVGELDADLVIEGNDLKLDAGLRTAVLISLFSDARAAADDKLPALDDPDRRGWWGENPADPFGSKLWLLWREKATAATAARAADYVRAALQWLITSAIAAEITVNASYGPLPQRALIVEVGIRRGTAQRWEQLWQGVENIEIDAHGVKVRLMPL